jgi:hypothetical protein
MTPLRPTILFGVLPVISVGFVSPRSSFNVRVKLLRAHNSENDVVDNQISINHHNRRDFLLLSSAFASMFTKCVSASAEETDYVYQRASEEGGDLTSKLFNPDGSLRDPNTVTEAQERLVNLSFSKSAASDVFTVSNDGSQPTVEGGLKVSYKLPTKWNSDPSLQLPLYYDSSEGKNGKACNRITVYSISVPNLNMSVLDKASKVGVAKSLFMDKLPNKYFDQGVLKADLISGRTSRKPIKDGDAIDEQIYYEFDLAFAPLECPKYEEGNKENLGLGFCPYDSIFLVSATVLEKEGTMVVGVVECNKDEWKIANSDLRRVRSSFEVNRA